MSTEQNELNDDHPLVLELSSLRQTAARFQHEAHQAALKLQRHALSTAHTNDHLHLLESRHSVLASELATLRAHPLPSPHSQSDTHVVQELTLALRRSSEKLDLTEHALAEKTAELISTRNEAQKARHDADGAYKLAASARAREEEGKIRERGLSARVHAAEEERRLTELVVREYADLVRSLDGRKSSLGNGSALQNGSASASSLTLVEGLHEGKSSLHRLMSEFASLNEKHETTITQLRNEIANLESTLEAERKSASQDRAQLAKAQLELEKLKLDDTTAAKMVSRYMKFSQSQTNALQSTLTTLQARNAATQHTLQSTINDSEARLHSHMTDNARLRDALEELGEEVTREAYGRRREISLRLALLAREEALGEALRRWVRRAQEGIHRCTDADIQMYATFERAVKDAEGLLMTLDAEVALDDGSKVPGVLGRLILAKDAVMRMSEEVGVEVGRRVAAERRFSLGVEPLDEAVHEPSVSVSEKLDSVSGQAPVDVAEHPHTQDAELTTDANTDIPHTQDAKPSPQTPTPLPSLPVEGHKDTEGTPSPNLDLPADGHRDIEGTPSPVVRDTTPGNSRLLLIDDLPVGPSQSPAVSILDLTQTPSGEVASISLPSAELRTPLASVDEVAIEPDSGVFFTPAATTLEVKAVSPADEPNNSTVDIIPQPQLPDEISSLLSSLNKVNHRYDALQHAFRDCSLALKDLKRMLPPIASTPSPSPHSLLRTVLERISDYTEDARVELEIRITDESLAIRGFETLLTVPGALSSDSDSALEETRAFVDGTLESVCKARERLEGKLGDVQHDVAVIKRAVHELQLHDNDEKGGDEGLGLGENKTWSGWTAGLLPRSSTPSPSQPTFGSVMTSPQLRHSPSMITKQLPSLAGLELRIPMPLTADPHVPVYAGLGMGAAPGVGVGQRQRTISMMYSLGIGSRGSSLGVPGMSPVKGGGGRSQNRFATAPLWNGTATGIGQTQTQTQGQGGNESDVE
ncbi:uncharacterized protein EDB91DRAFT_1213758 [Suillus paluster]|uniref:uncharacterized protein n=1 Tax=Suillus paluster TaxID=48578 RepID=UPI001B85BFF3|nr:uncharacterized protein EDB91DRAFT_1213758 [Suillus paluster]KAG1756878.1 hypothetical protein EDB91DRAFT_1213758 [Suillus paluster]